MDDQLIRLFTENSTTILLTILTTVTSTLLMGLRNLAQSAKKTETDIGDIHRLVNGGLTSRLNQLTLRIQNHLDDRFNELEHRLRGLEGRLFVVENDHAAETERDAPTDVQNFKK